MKQALQNPEIPLHEAEKHYELSRENYTIEGAESHLAYYRDKHPVYYQLLLNN
ncbi:hypothetical protein [Tenacibaculum ovolyticum]|uniref:hypothetical protein n=1 Tax=Tenacibaculum ovolyticum TaxID=104270 RepID=UPI001F201178|nr:hypothetical protein [Tenacibaculum ovolyticum]